MSRHLTILILLFITSFSYAAGLESKPGAGAQATPTSVLAAWDVGSDDGAYIRLAIKPEANADNSKWFAERHLVQKQPPSFSARALEGSMVDPDSLKIVKMAAAEKVQGPVPESSTMLLLGLGLLGLSGFGARRKFRR